LIDSNSVEFTLIPAVIVVPTVREVPTVRDVPTEADAVAARVFDAIAPVAVTLVNVGLATVVIFGVVPPEDKIFPDPVTEVTGVPAVVLMVSLGHDPVMDIPPPAIRLGVAVPVPPLAIGRGEVMEILGFDPPVDARGLDAVTEATPAPPVVALIV
jgi:hypothetical protein